MAKHIFVIGGVLSSLGKGIASSSVGLLLKKMGYNVVMQKFDPYLNVDPDTMNPSHPFYIGVQYHPEFKTRPDKPQPIFREFVKVAGNRKKK